MCISSRQCNGFVVRAERVPKGHGHCSSGTARSCGLHGRYCGTWAILLLRLLQKEAKWQWSPECQVAFDKLKHLVTSAPILAHSSFAADTIVSCNAPEVTLEQCCLRYKTDRSAQWYMRLVFSRQLRRNTRVGKREGCHGLHLGLREIKHIFVWPQVPPPYSPPSVDITTFRIGNRSEVVTLTPLDGTVIQIHVPITISTSSL